MIFKVFLLLLSFAGQANNLKKNELRNPSWQELKQFLKSDQTDTKQYQSGVFNCQGFAIEIRDNARDNEFRCAYVTLKFEGKSVGHALNSFVINTNEHVYVDAGGEDSIAYVERGKPYGLISVDAVQHQGSIGCDDVDSFSGSIFSYNYFEAHERCRSFLKQSWLNYNGAVEDYNVKQESYGGRRRRIKRQLDNAREQQNKEQENISRHRNSLVLTDIDAVESYNKRVAAFNLANEEHNRRVDEFNADDAEKIALDGERSKLNQHKEALSKLEKALGPSRFIEGTVSQIQEYW